MSDTRFSCLCTVSAAARVGASSSRGAVLARIAATGADPLTWSVVWTSYVRGMTASAAAVSATTPSQTPRKSTGCRRSERITISP